jgi:hypothetical protein
LAEQSRRGDTQQSLNEGDQHQSCRVGAGPGDIALQRLHCGLGGSGKNNAVQSRLFDIQHETRQ